MNPYRQPADGVDRETSDAFGTLTITKVCAHCGGKVVGTGLRWFGEFVPLRNGRTGLVCFDCLLGDDRGQFLRTWSKP